MKILFLFNKKFLCLFKFEITTIIKSKFKKIKLENINIFEYINEIVKLFK